MNRIRLLPEQVANQIAAGEVIERPASVAKELVENAIDAGSRRIAVETQGGGRQLVRVTDDGVGMSRDDALLCLERHATSKIRKAEDLAAVTTMGFRGEALPSIASVSRFVLTTREREGDSPEASQIVVHGGKIIEVRTAGHPPGTSVEVRSLFFNLPARRKFLRSEETENAHIAHYLTLAALAHPEVGFTLQQEERVLFQLPPAPPSQDPAAGVRDRLRVLLGSGVPLVPVDHTAALRSWGTSAADECEEAEPAVTVRVWGFIGAPGVSRATRQDQHLFVNRRPVENRGLNYALLEGYHTALMKGRYPICCLFLEIDPAEVDVNVHPAKREVKFRHEHAVRQQVMDAVRRALLALQPAGESAAPVDPGSPTPQATVRPAIPLGPESKPTASQPKLSLDQPRSATPEPVGPIPAPLPIDHRTSTGLPAELTSGAQAPGASPSIVSAAIEPALPPPPRLPTEAADPAAGPATAGAATTGPAPLLQVPLRLIGVVGRLYVLFESDRGLVLMDQHAAHERILYEQLLRRLEHGEAPSQRLLLPETVEVSPRDAVFLRENLSLLTRLGVGLSEFGERTFLLDALPPFVKVKDARAFVIELVDELAAAGRAVNAMRLGESMVAKTVCRHAVKANDPLSEPELRKLLEDLRACELPYTCPHGRPTLLEMNYRELEKKFGRIQP